MKIVLCLIEFAPFVRSIRFLSQNVPRKEFKDTPLGVFGVDRRLANSRSSLIPGADRKQELYDVLMPLFSSLAQWRSPFSERPPGCRFNRYARIDIRSAAHQKLDNIQMPCAARDNEGVLVTWNDLIDVCASIEKQRDNVHVSFTRSHDQGIPVPKHGCVGISPAVQQKPNRFNVAFAGS